VAESILAQRKNFYNMLVDKNDSQSCFLDGWLNRLTHVREGAGL
jgi:hypothetical protein